LCLVIQPATGYLSEHLGLFPEIETGWALIKMALLGSALFLGILRIPTHICGFTGFMGTLLLVWIILLQIIQAPTLSRDFPLETRRVLGNTLLTGPGLWLVGISIPSIWHRVKEQRIWQVQSWSFFIIYVGVLVLGLVTTFNRYGSLWGIYLNPRPKISYLEIADNLAIMAFWIASLANRRGVRNVVLILSGALLFFCLSRASFYGYLSVLALFVFLRSRWSVRIFLFIIVLVVIAVGVYSSVQFTPVTWGYRMLTIQSPGADESLQMRVYYLDKGLQRLSKHWLFGNFMAEVTLGEGPGTYIHNWLSFWESYGLGPFLLSLMVFIFAVIYAIRIAISRKNMLSGVALFYACVCFYCVISVIFARAYIWPYIWLPIGLVSAGCNSKSFRSADANRLLRSSGC
jgi:hypothetical protein